MRVTAKSARRRTDTLGRSDRKGSRYGVEIRGESVHAEVENLAHVSAFLQGRAGQARVFDRMSGLLFEGSSSDVLRAVAALTKILHENGQGKGIEL